LYAKFSKYEFLLESAALMGHIVSKDGIMVDPMKVDVVCGWALPTSPIEVHSFIRLESYYKQFIEVFFYYDTFD